MNNRKFDDLSDMDQGVFMVRDEIQKYHDNHMLLSNEPSVSVLAAMKAIENCLTICDECLDIATLGEVEK